jgi:hypothetical protein
MRHCYRAENLKLVISKMAKRNRAASVLKPSAADNVPASHPLKPHQTRMKLLESVNDVQLFAEFAARNVW